MGDWAWIVEDDTGEGQEVLFTSPGDTESSPNGKRAPQFDGLDGADLARAQLACGWWFHCWECEHQLDADGLINCGERECKCCDCGDEHCSNCGFDQHCVELPIVDGFAVFCSRYCWHAWMWERGRIRGNRKAVQIEALERWPGIELVDANGSELDPRKPGRSCGAVDFKFPGGAGTVHWVRGCAIVNVQARDIDAWKVFSEACRA